MCVCVHIPAVQAAAAAAARQATHEAAHVPVCEVMIDLVGEVLLEVAQLVRPRRHAQVQQVGLGRRGARAEVLLEAPPPALALVLAVEQALPDGRQRLQPWRAHVTRNASNNLLPSICLNVTKFSIIQAAIGGTSSALHFLRYIINCIEYVSTNRQLYPAV